MVKRQNKTANKTAGTGSSFKLTVGMKLFMLIFCSIVLSVIATGMISMSVSKTIIEDNARDNAYQTIHQTREKIDLLLEKYEQIGSEFLTNLNLHLLISTANSDGVNNYEAFSAQQKISEQLGQITYSNKSVSAISMLPVDPEKKAFTVNSAKVEPYLDEAWFQGILDNPKDFTWMHTLEKGYTGTAGKPSFAVGRLINTNYGEKYVILIEVDQSVLSEKLEGISLSESSEVYITDQDNQLMQITNDQAFGDFAELSVPIDNKDMPEDKIIVEDQSGTEHMAVYDYSAKADWYVVGTAPVTELTKDTVQIQNVTIIILLVAAAFGIVASIITAKKMGGPLRKLQKLMNEGAKGNLNVRTDFRSRDEVGEVGRSFNEMMNQIKQLVQQTNSSATDVLDTAVQLSSAAKETAHSSREISEATEQIAHGASTLAVEAERGNELVMDLNNQFQNVVTTNRMMGEVASEVHKVSEQGTGYMIQLSDKTKQTEEMTGRMVEKVDQLKESTASIKNILDLLVQITQQTNILALNASIEASRSGAAGRGFMVIAGEIRKLADQSKQSIEVVAEMTDHIQHGIDETVSVLSEAYPMFQEQINSVKDAEKIFNNVRQRMVEFVTQADEVTVSIEQLEKSQHVISETMASVSAVSEQSSAISEEVASSSASQLSTSDSLVGLADKLESLSNALSNALKRFEV